MKPSSPSNAACQRFREDLLSGKQPEPNIAQDPHRDQCPECARFAEVLESSTAVETPRPMSARLRDRLREIPRHEVTCRDVERLYREAKRQAGAATEDREPDPASAQHLASCERCRVTYGTLQCAFEPERLAMPTRLARRLGEIAKRPERLVPVWISDTRYAAAACYLVATLTLAVTDNASAVLSEATQNMTSRVSVWAAAGEDRGNRVWVAATAPLERGLAEGWNRFDSYREAGSRWAGDAYRAIEDTTRELIPDRRRSVEGENP
ncbi:MAG: hypothetical protein AAF560_19390 [Acidobacteriota bacterium]